MSRIPNEVSPRTLFWLWYERATLAQKQVATTDFQRFVAQAEKMSNGHPLNPSHTQTENGSSTATTPENNPKALRLRSQQLRAKSQKQLLRSQELRRQSKRLTQKGQHSKFGISIDHTIVSHNRH